MVHSADKHPMSLTPCHPSLCRDMGTCPVLGLSAFLPHLSSGGHLFGYCDACLQEEAEVADTYHLRAVQSHQTPIC